jgi:hypothetical protein
MVAALPSSSAPVANEESFTPPARCQLSTFAISYGYQLRKNQLALYLIMSTVFSLPVIIIYFR